MLQEKSCSQKEFLYLFFNTFIQNLSAFIFQFQICVINWLMPDSFILPEQRLCLFSPSMKYEHNKYLFLNECYHCTEHEDN